MDVGRHLLDGEAIEIDKHDDARTGTLNPQALVSRREMCIWDRPTCSAICACVWLP